MWYVSTVKQNKKLEKSTGFKTVISDHNDTMRTRKLKPERRGKEKGKK